MTSEEAAQDYHLGYSDAEAERLMRQGERLEPATEQFLREAGVGPGMHVLDVGSGVGDVVLLLHRIVGPQGQVVGVERDGSSIGRARERLASAGVDNVRLEQADIGSYDASDPFDAAVGRYVLQFLPDPVSVLRRLSAMVKPGGIIAFQEPSFAPFVQFSESLPLRRACTRWLRDLAVASGVDVEMGIGLHAAFQAAGLPAPRMRLVMELGLEPEYTRLLADAIKSVYPRAIKSGFDTAPVGDLAALETRLQEEAERSNAVVPWIAMVGAWSRTQAGAKQG